MLKTSGSALLAFHPTSFSAAGFVIRGTSISEIDAIHCHCETAPNVSVISLGRPIPVTYCFCRRQQSFFFHKSAKGKQRSNGTGNEKGTHICIVGFVSYLNWLNRPILFGIFCNYTQLNIKNRFATVFRAHSSFLSIAFSSNSSQIADFFSRFLLYISVINRKFCVPRKWRDLYQNIHGSKLECKAEAVVEPLSPFYCVFRLAVVRICHVPGNTTSNFVRSNVWNWTKLSSGWEWLKCCWCNYSI